MNELVVFSHLRWDFVYRRPQQILSRLAQRWRVPFVEEPVFAAGDPRAELHAPQNGVTVLTPHTPLTAPGFHDDQIPLLSKLEFRHHPRRLLRRVAALPLGPCVRRRQEGRGDGAAAHGDAGRCEERVRRAASIPATR